MLIKFDRKFTGQQLLDEFRSAIQSLDRGDELHWDMMGQPGAIQYNVVGNLAKRREFHTIIACPTVRFHAFGLGVKSSMPHPAWGDIKSISLEPVLEDEQYDQINLVLGGIDVKDEARRNRNTKGMLDQVVQAFWENLLMTPAAKAA